MENEKTYQIGAEVYSLSLEGYFSWYHYYLADQHFLEKVPTRFFVSAQMDSETGKIQY